MSSRLISRLFHKEDKDPSPPPRRTDPEAPGILASSCAINGRRTRRYKLPIPDPAQRQIELHKLAAHTHPRNPQRQSAFFRTLPREVRDQIYRALFGGRRVHIEHAWKRPCVFRPLPAAKELQQFHWQWWHRLCEVSDRWVANRYAERCASFVDESDDARRFGWRLPPDGTNLADVEMLRGYDECLPVLYGSSVFVTGPGMDTPFIMSRLLLPPPYTALINAMDVAFTVVMPYTAPPDLPGNWATVYPAFFALFQRSFCSVRRLRMTMILNPWGKSQVPVTEESLDAFLAPWEALAASRDWSRLEFFVPEDWYELLKERAETQERWTLRVTGYREVIPTECVL